MSAVPVISGYAALFDVETVIGGAFRETIRRGAFAATIRRDDIRAFFNHSPDVILGRLKAGSLTLEEDARGLRYVVEINEADPAALAVAARIARGDVSGSSFSFGVTGANGEEWQLGARSELPLRTLHRLRVIDVGPVVFPVYPETTSTVGTRTQTLAAVRDLMRAKLQVAKARLWAAW